MIKKILLSLGLIGIGFIGFSYGEFTLKETGTIGSYTYQLLEINLDGEYGYNGSSYLNNTIYTDGHFENGQLLAFGTSNRYFTFGYVNGTPYGVAQFSTSIIMAQGYMTGLCVSNISDLISNCGVVYYNDMPKYNSNWENINKNVSFDKSYFITTYNSNTPIFGNASVFCLANTIEDFAYCWDFSSYNEASRFINGGNLVSSPASISNSSMYDIFDTESPFIGGGSSSSGGINYTCTKEIALKWYEKNGYSSKLCYGGFNNFNLFTGAINDLPFYGSGLDIEEIWFNTAQYRIYGDTGSGMGYDDWFHYWRLVYNSYYRTINEGGVMGNPFDNTPLVLFTYFSAVNQFGRNFRDKDILEYCDLKLYTSDYSSVYSGNYGNKVCSPLVLLEESIDNLNSSGDVNVGVNIGGSGNSGQNFTDGKSFIQSFVQFIDSDKFKGTNTGFNGIIPGYIVLVLCAIIFFRFIMH